MVNKIRSAVQKPSANSLGEQAYLALKGLILNGELKPGDQVNVAQLSEQLELGKNPVHLATHRLAREGLVDILPRKGIIIRAETLDSFLNLLESRELVEPHLAAAAVDHLNPELIAKLEALIEQGRAFFAQGDRQGGMRVDRQFHQILYEAAGNDLLAEFACHLLDRSMRLWFTSSPANNDKRASIEELNDLLSTMKQGDKTLTAELMKAHISSVRQKFLA